MLSAAYSEGLSLSGGCSLDTFVCVYIYIYIMYVYIYIYICTHIRISIMLIIRSISFSTLILFRWRSPTDRHACELRCAVFWLRTHGVDTNGVDTNGVDTSNEF